MSTAASPMRDFAQELRTNPKTQVTAGVFVAVLAGMVWMLWPESHKAPARGSSGPVLSALLPEGRDPQLDALRKLPDLARLDRAGELPKDPAMARDMFLFDTPQRTPAVYEIFVPPPAPPSASEIEAKRLADERRAEEATRPSGVRYLGYLATRRRGQLGAFMKGEEPLTLPIGDLSFKGWKLVKLDENSAEFQNLKFPDMRHKIQPSDGAGPKVDAVRNDF